MNLIFALLFVVVSIEAVFVFGGVTGPASDSGAIFALCLLLVAAIASALRAKEKDHD